MTVKERNNEKRMPKQCEVVGCPNALDKNKGKKHLFCFPETVAVKWIEATGRKNWIPNEGSAICEIHFKSEDFSNTKIRRRLKADVIPTQNLFITSIINMKKEEVETSQQEEVKTIKEEINEIYSEPMIDIKIEEIKTTQEEQVKNVQEENNEIYLKSVIDIEEISTGQRKKKALNALEEAELKIRKLKKGNNELKELIRSLREEREKELQIQGNALRDIIEQQKKESREKLAVKNKQLKILRIQIKRKDNKINDLLTKAKTI